MSGTPLDAISSNVSSHLCLCPSKVDCHDDMPDLWDAMLPDGNKLCQAWEPHLDQNELQHCLVVLES